MRVCLVTPFSWSVPHEVNDHVAGVAVELRKLGHRVTVLAPSGKAGAPAPEPAKSAPTATAAAE